MEIKFIEPDPRAGMTADIDSSLGQSFIDKKCAVLCKAGEPVVAVETCQKASDPRQNKMVEAPSNKTTSKPGAKPGKAR